MKAESGAQRIKRRGILAAAGAVVAGIVAKRASEPVAATSGTGIDGNLVLGSNDSGTNYANSRTQLVSGLGNPTGNGFRGTILFDCSASPFQSSGDTNVVGISGVSRGSAAGIYGADTTNKPSGFPANMNAGVYGYAYNQGHSGVRGDGGSFGMGVSGASFNSNAILGTTLSSTFNPNAAVLGLGYGIGVEGDVASGANQTNTVAVKGVNQASTASGIGVLGQCDSTTGIGVQGQSTSGVGVFGVSNGNAGVLGISNAPGNVGIGGIANVSGTAAFAGTSTNPNAFAGFFTGDVFINGNFTVQDPTRKHGAIQHPDGSLRLLYSMESPESWLEDFGKGQLAGGKAEVKLDADFAAVVQTGDYRVFPVPEGDCNGLYVTNKTAAGFEVRELRGGTANVPFSYRVVARPKTTNKATRLAKFTVPDIKLPGAGGSALPSVSKTPDAPQAAPPPRPSPPASGTQDNAQDPTLNPVQPIPPPRSG